MSGDQLNHHNSPAAEAGAWQFGNQGSADSMYPNPWNHPNANKRKMKNQDIELVQEPQASQFYAEIPMENAKVDTNDGAKQDYIHVRARSGQATNSHSIAERVRRERISERMKYLQDIVPSCNKVTGKAVMLDEIINYVQSLQRQVEFLSMKLAAVNPSIDLNIDCSVSKDILHPRVGPPVGFSPELFHLQLLPSQQRLAHTGISGMMSNPWEAELQSMGQMNYGANPPPNTQEFNGKPHDGFQL